MRMTGGRIADPEKLRPHEASDIIEALKAMIRRREIDRMAAAVGVTDAKAFVSSLLGRRVVDLSKLTAQESQAVRQAFEKMTRTLAPSKDRPGEVGKDAGGRDAAGGPGEG